MLAMKIPINAVGPIKLVEIATSIAMTAKYFGMLSEDDIEKLYQVYQDDFQLFNYTFTHGRLKFP